MATAQTGSPGQIGKHLPAPREQFVQVVVREIRAARVRHRVTIQSFDWGR